LTIIDYYNNYYVKFLKGQGDIRSLFTRLPERHMDVEIREEFIQILDIFRWFVSMW
jgi:hypothetical protein